MAWVRALIVGIIDNAFQLSETVAEGLDVLTKLGVFDVCTEQMVYKSTKQSCQELPRVTRLLRPPRLLASSGIGPA